MKQWTESAIYTALTLAKTRRHSIVEAEGVCLTVEYLGDLLTVVFESGQFAGYGAAMRVASYPDYEALKRRVSEQLSNVIIRWYDENHSGSVLDARDRRVVSRPPRESSERPVSVRRNGAVR